MIEVSGNAPSAALGFENPLGGRGISGEFLDGAAWSADKLAAAIRTMPFQCIRGAVRAESAFEGTDPGVAGLTRQIPIATLAVGTQLQHLRYLTTCLLEL
jgi:hypothetical protein